MPIDHKRINGPEESVPYELFARLSGITSEKTFEEIQSANKRCDGRDLDEHRKICMFMVRISYLILIIHLLRFKKWSRHSSKRVCLYGNGSNKSNGIRF